MTTILLLRHGENEWVREHRLAGWIPGVHLNENGRAQARAAAERLKNLPITAVYTSPVERCVETAETVAAVLDKEPHPLPEVGEVKYGDWEGAEIKRLAELPEWHTVQHYPSRFEFPAGETLRGVQTRAVNALEKLAAVHDGETIIVCSHADLIKLVLAHYLGTHIDLFQRIVISPASVSVLHLMKDGGMRVVRLNDTGPLAAPQPSVTKKPSPHNDDRS